jgi:hypothetical protein
VAHDHGVEHPVVFEGELVLAQLAEALARLHRDVSRRRLQVAAQNLHQRRFAAAVGADQTVAIAVRRI